MKIWEFSSIKWFDIFGRKKSANLSESGNSSLFKTNFNFPYLFIYGFSGLDLGTPCMQILNEFHGFSAQTQDWKLIWKVFLSFSNTFNWNEIEIKSKAKILRSKLDRSQSKVLLPLVCRRDPFAFLHIPDNVLRALVFLVYLKLRK